ncbi:hypothetical protein GCM10010124_14740 [Pilimelia terevasa]|uniref:Uncharacterized protein n=1 Tax=Pilimelia terevasa TaxID=53372 RepID=A0A8J3BHV2_9ACTN|nr:hypothetical protein [Pilimelia terevasa]GGK23280.1 hypothetical protein GCM10010124_14740 [Pilimelia terevasa]
MWPFRRHRRAAPQVGGVGAAGPVARAARAGWRELSPLARLIGPAPLLHTAQRTAATLTTWQDPRHLTTLAHAVRADAPAGVLHDVPGVALPVRGAGPRPAGHRARASAGVDDRPAAAAAAPPTPGRATGAVLPTPIGPPLTVASSPPADRELFVARDWSATGDLPATGDLSAARDRPAAAGEPAGESRPLPPPEAVPPTHTAPTPASPPPATPLSPPATAPSPSGAPPRSAVPPPLVVARAPDAAAPPPALPDLRPAGLPDAPPVGHPDRAAPPRLGLGAPLGTGREPAEVRRPVLPAGTGADTAGPVRTGPATVARAVSTELPVSGPRTAPAPGPGTPPATSPAPAPGAETPAAPETAPAVPATTADLPVVGTVSAQRAADPPPTPAAADVSAAVDAASPEASTLIDTAFPGGPPARDVTSSGSSAGLDTAIPEAAAAGAAPPVADAAHSPLPVAARRPAPAPGSPPPGWTSPQSDAGVPPPVARLIGERTPRIYAEGAGTPVTGSHPGGTAIPAAVPVEWRHPSSPVQRAAENPPTASRTTAPTGAPLTAGTPPPARVPLTVGAPPPGPAASGAAPRVGPVDFGAGGRGSVQRQTAQFPHSGPAQPSGNNARPPLAPEALRAASGLPAVPAPALPAAPYPTVESYPTVAGLAADARAHRPAAHPAPLSPPPPLVVARAANQPRPSSATPAAPGTPAPAAHPPAAVLPAAASAAWAAADRGAAPPTAEELAAAYPDVFHLQRADGTVTLTAATPEAQAHAAPPPAAGAAPPAGPPAPSAAAPPAGQEAVLASLFDPLLRRLRAELRLDRERRGLLTDLRH